MSMPTYTLNNTNNTKLTELNTTFESIRRTVHIVVMDAGTSSLSKTLKNYYYVTNIDSNTKCVTLQEDDMSRASLCALCFIRKGFQFASALQGRFASAHVYLDRSPDFLTKLPSPLMDFDPSRSLVAKLEAACVDQCRSKTSLTEKMTMIKLHHFMDNSMSNLTVTQQQIEKSPLEKSNDEHLIIEDNEEEDVPRASHDNTNV